MEKEGIALFQLKLFQYLQIRHLCVGLSPMLTRNLKIIFSVIFFGQPTSKHLISQFAKVFVIPVNASRLREAWAN